jgi:hypothetical protein
MWRDFAKALRDLLRMPGEGGAYRPDLHYMRGPGPKWHAKYGNLYAKSGAGAQLAKTPVHQVAQRRA